MEMCVSMMTNKMKYFAALVVRAYDFNLFYFADPVNKADILYGNHFCRRPGINDVSLYCPHSAFVIDHKPT